MIYLYSFREVTINSSVKMALRTARSQVAHVQLPELSGHSRKVYALGFNCNGSMLASGSNDRSIRIWNPVTVSVGFNFLTDETSCTN